MMSKTYILTLLLSIIFHLSYSQTETFLDTILVKKEIENSKGINVEELCSAVWVIKQATFQFQYPDSENNMIMDMDNWEGFTYTFDANGTYEVDAIIDSDGKWELRDNGKTLYLYNNLRKDEELHSVIIDGNTMKWFLLVEMSLVYQYFDKQH